MNFSFQHQQAVRQAAGLRRRVRFQLNPGEKVGLVGPNGANGKTTLFRMIVWVRKTPTRAKSRCQKKLTIGYFRPRMSRR